MNNSIPYWLQILISAGFFSILWEIFQFFITKLFERKNHYLNFLMNKMFIPFHKKLEPHLFYFPQDNEKDLQNLSYLLEEFIITIKENDKLNFYVEDKLLRYALASLESINNHLHSPSSFFFFNTYLKSQTKFYKFSSLYFYLMNKSRKINGLRKRNIIYLWRYHTTELRDLLFPINYFSLKLQEITLKFLKSYFKFVLLATLLIILLTLLTT